MNDKALQPLLVQAAMSMLPPDIQRALLEHRAFLAQWHVSVAITASLAPDGPSFRRNELYNGMRSAIREQERVVAIHDQNGTAWELRAKLQDKAMVFLLRAGEISFNLMDFSALAEDEKTRVDWLERAARIFHIESVIYQKWLDRLHQSALGDDDFADLMAEIELAPANIFINLRTGMAKANIDVATLVPGELGYYERLVGQLGSTSSAAEYINVGARTRVADFQRWGTSEGYLNSLLICSEGSITKLIQLNGLGQEELLQTHQWLLDHGDLLSRVGAIEVSLANLDTCPELSPFTEKIIETFIAADPADQEGDLVLLCAMTIMVLSEMSRRKILKDSPPFYRKHAALAHASHVIRAIHASNIKPSSFVEWIQAQGVGSIYFLQGLVDLRLEPRWLPEFIDPKVLRAEFIGRILNCAMENEARIQSKSLRDFILGADSKLGRVCRWPDHALPGPLQGETSHGPPKPSDELVLKVRSALGAELLEPDSFAALVNMALVFSWPKELADLAAAAINKVRFVIESSADERKISGLIHGLASVAATTRSSDLAEALCVFLRTLRRRKRFTLSPSDELRIALTTGASFEQLDEWARFVGEWTTEIAFESVDKSAAEHLLHELRRLVQIEPALARHCAAADAALSAFAP